MKPVIGFIGIGTMGTFMSRNLIKQGYKVVVHDLNELAMDYLVEAGATKTSNPRDLARQSSVVITMLPASPDVEAVTVTVCGPSEPVGTPVTVQVLPPVAVTV